MKGWCIAGLVAAVARDGRDGPGAGAAAPARRGGARRRPEAGYVDVQRVLARSSAGVAAREQLEREKATMQKEMDAKRQELEKLREELEKKGPLMTADARREKQDTFERKRRDAARLADDFQKELEKKEQALLQRVLAGGVRGHRAARQAARLLPGPREAQRAASSTRARRRPHRRGHPGLRPGSGRRRKAMRRTPASRSASSPPPSAPRSRAIPTRVLTRGGAAGRGGPPPTSPS